MKQGAPSRMRSRGIAAWVVTWEGTGRHASRKAGKIELILRHTVPPKIVAEVVEALYLRASDSIGAQVRGAKVRGHRPYPARFDEVDGVPWHDRLECGHNPWLEARRVKDLRVEVDARGRDVPKWDERTRPRIRILESKRHP